MGCLLPILMVPVSVAALATMALLFLAIPDPGHPVQAAIKHTWGPGSMPGKDARIQLAAAKARGRFNGARLQSPGMTHPWHRPS